MVGRFTFASVWSFCVTLIADDRMFIGSSTVALRVVGVSPCKTGTVSCWELVRPQNTRLEADPRSVNEKVVVSALVPESPGAPHARRSASGQHANHTGHCDNSAYILLVPHANSMHSFGRHRNWIEFLRRVGPHAGSPCWLPRKRTAAFLPDHPVRASTEPNRFLTPRGPPRRWTGRGVLPHGQGIAANTAARFPTRGREAADPISGSSAR